jgi:hypothetical protein
MDAAGGTCVDRPWLTYVQRVWLTYVQRLWLTYVQRLWLTGIVLLLGTFINIVISIYASNNSSVTVAQVFFLRITIVQLFFRTGSGSCPQIPVSR